MKECREIIQELSLPDKMKSTAENFKVQPYFTENILSDAIFLFSSQCEMLKMNLKNNPKFISQNWKCTDCKKTDVQQHLLWCPGYEQLRTGRYLNCYKDLVS